MINYSAYLYDTDSDWSGNEEQMNIHSCGFYGLGKEEIFRTYRKDGREDYLLLYVAGGYGDFSIGGTIQHLGEGNLILYRPGDEQDYTYYGKYHTKVYWIHFGGGGVEELLEENKINESVNVVGIDAIYNDLFEQIIKEFMLKRYGYIDMNRIVFTKLLMLFARSVVEQTGGTNTRNEKLEQFIEMFHREYKKPFDIEELAIEYGLTTCWFIKVFKRYTGYTPGQYITRIRLEKAKELLQSGTYNISEIANACGYENPLYFSRLFRKNFGKSPKEYRCYFTNSLKEDIMS